MTKVSLALLLSLKRTVTWPLADGAAATDETEALAPGAGLHAELLVVGHGSMRSCTPSPSESSGPPLAGESGSRSLITGGLLSAAGLGATGVGLIGAGVLVTGEGTGVVVAGASLKR